MLKVSHSGAALIFLATTLTLAGVACSNNKMTTVGGSTQPIALSTPSAVPASPESPAPLTNAEPKKVKAALQPSPYELALDKAYGALSISQSAQSADDWNLVVSQWQDAIALMRIVSKSSPDRAMAQKKIAEYQRNLKYAQQQATRPITKAEPESAAAVIPEPLPAPSVISPPVVVAPSPVPSSQPVYQAEIKRRAGGTPVIDVIFNGTQQFEMIVDTGASGTVITQKTAAALGVVPVAKAKANTASARAVEFPIGYVDSIEVDGAVVKDLPIAIAPSPDLEIGLLGHDFLGKYDITIKRDIVEFRTRDGDN